MSKPAVFCPHLLNKFLTEKFVHWFMQVNRHKTTVKKEITHILKNFVTSLFTFFEKFFAICKFFTAQCLDVRFLYFTCLKFNPQYRYLLLCKEHVCWFGEGKGRNFCCIFTKSQKLCLHKMFAIGSTMKINCREFYFFKLDLKCT